MSFNSAAHPAGWVDVTTARHGKLFLQGDAVTFTLSAATAVAYEVRDYYGTVVKSGTFSGTTLTLTGLPLGWFKLYLFQAGTDATYGAVIGCCMFSIIRSGALAAPPVPSGTGSADPFFESPDHIARGIALLGPMRNQISNAASISADLTTVQADRVYQRDWYEANPDTARPRPAFLQFPNGGFQDSAHIAGVTSAVGTLYPDIKYFEGPQNEPSVGGAAAAMATFRDAVKAGNASAKVMGPGPVSVNAGQLSALDAFLTAGGATGIDALSFHAYNCINGDIALGRRTLDGFKALLASHGLSGLELWQTEWGQFAATYGVFHPRRQVRWWAIHRLLLDQYGVPKERDYWFYDRSHGFWDFPSFWKAGDELTPLITICRAMSEELFGKTWAARLDFGTEGNDQYIGSRYTATDGSSVLALISGGRTDGRVTLSSSSSDPLTVVDAFGNTSSATIVGGKTTITVGCEPVYVRVPTGVTVAVEQLFYGQNLLKHAVGTAPGTADPSKPLNGVLENSYDGGATEYRDDHALPSTLTATLPSPRLIDTVVAHCPTPWQSQSTLLDFDVEYRTEDGTWHVARTITEPTLTILAPSGTDQTACFYDTFHSGRSIFEVTFAPVRATAVRLTVRDTTNGGEPTAAAEAAGGQGNSVKYVSLRELRAYCRTPKRHRAFAARSTI